MGINRLPGLEDRFKPWLAEEEDDVDVDDDSEEVQYRTYSMHPQYVPSVIDRPPKPCIAS